MSIPMLGLGVAELYYGISTYLFTQNYKLGAWYVGAITIAASLIGFSSSIKFFQVIFPFSCILVVVIAFIGTLIDGIGYAFSGYLKACSHANSQFWGDSSYWTDLTDACPLPQDGRDCYCVISHSSPCYSYNGNAGSFDSDNCDPLIEDYPKLLRASWSICLATFFLGMVASIVAFTACCGRLTTKDNPDRTPLAPQQDRNAENTSTLMYAQPPPPGVVYAYSPPLPQVYAQPVAYVMYPSEASSAPGMAVLPPSAPPLSKA